MSRSSSITNTEIQNSLEAISSKSVFSLELTTPTWFHNLPVNILIKIFQHFTEKELQKNITPVCQRWRHAALRPELWKRIEFNGEKNPVYIICRKLRRFQLLETIICENLSETKDVIRQICRSNPLLKYLAIRNSCAVTEACLRNLIQKCKYLSALDLSGSQFRAFKFYQELARLKNLKSVNLSKNSQLSLNNLLTFILNCHGLEELRISRYTASETFQQLNDKDASFIFSNLASTLRSLTIDASTLNNITFHSIMNCHKLERLCLYGAANLSGEVFMDIWKHLSCLTKMKIRHAHQITGKHVFELFTNGAVVMKQLVLLDFTGCWKITDLGIHAIADRCPNLKSVTLKSCKSIENIGPLQEKCKEILYLNVAYCHNLNPSTMQLEWRSLKAIVIDDDYKFHEVISHFLESNPTLKVQIATSEYNKIMRPFV